MVGGGGGGRVRQSLTAESLGSEGKQTVCVLGGGDVEIASRFIIERPCSNTRVDL